MKNKLIAFFAIFLVFSMTVGCGCNSADEPLENLGGGGGDGGDGGGGGGDGSANPGPGPGPGPGGGSTNSDGSGSVTPPNPASPIKLSASSVTSSTVTLNWETPADAGAINVYIAPEPPAKNGDPFPAEILLKSLAVTDSSFKITGIAPFADIFARVEVTSPGGTVSDYIHAKMVGGPRAVLDNSVREVHAYAPTILQVVVADGDGSILQDKKSWSVKDKDGKEITITNVWRQSFPVSAADYVKVQSNPDIYEIKSDKVTAVDHRIYLVLDQKLSSPSWFSITGPGGISMQLPFSDKYLETPVIQLNQVGYNPRATKRWAYVSGWMGTGGPLSLADFSATARVLKENGDQRDLVKDGLKIDQRSVLDSDAGTEVKEIDLSTIPADETAVYRVMIPGVGVSWRTSVSEHAAFRAFYVVMRGLFFNRWGGDLNAELTWWSRPQDHAFNDITTSDSNNDPDTMFCDWDQVLGFINCPIPTLGPPYTVDPITKANLKNDRKVLGGHHDAGDHDQRPMHTVVPQVLMRAFELNQAAFKDGQLNIPESKNGIPDILDEALWNIAAWEALQEADGGVRQGFDTYRNPQYSYSNFDDLPYWTYTKNKNMSARAAGIFAQAARLVAPFNKSKSDDLKDKAIKAYTYAKLNNAVSAFMLYPAGELYKLIKTDDSYRVDFETYWKNLQSMTDLYNFPSFAEFHLFMGDYMSDTINFMPDYLLAYYTSGGPFTNYGTLFGTTDEGLVSRTIVSFMNSYIKQQVADSFANDTINSSHAHRNPRRGGDAPDWGFGTYTNRYLDTLITVMQMGILNDSDKQKYFDSLSLAADYIFGGNPNGMSYVTGLGSRHPMEPLHTDSLIFIKDGKGAMPGIPVYGPVRDIGASGYLQSTKEAFYPALNQLPLLLRYGDTRPFVTCNEFTVWEIQAPLAELLGILIGPNMDPSKLTDNCGIDHCN